MKTVSLLKASLAFCSFAATSVALAGDGQDWLKIYKGPNNTASVFHGDYEFPNEESPKQVCARETRSEGYVVTCGQSIVPVSFDSNTLTISGGPVSQVQVFVCRSEYNAKDAEVGMLIARCAEYEYSTYVVNAFRFEPNGPMKGRMHVSLDVGLPREIGSYQSVEIQCEKQADTSVRCASKGGSTKVEVLIAAGEESNHDRVGTVTVVDAFGTTKVKKLRCYARETEEYGNGSVGCLPFVPAATQLR